MCVCQTLCYSLLPAEKMKTMQSIAKLNKKHRLQIQIKRRREKKRKNYQSVEWFSSECIAIRHQQTLTIGSNRKTKGNMNLFEFCGNDSVYEPTRYQCAYCLDLDSNAYCSNVRCADCGWSVETTGTPKIIKKKNAQIKFYRQKWIDIAVSCHTFSLLLLLLIFSFHLNIATLHCTLQTHVTYIHIAIPKSKYARFWEF